MRKRKEKVQSWIPHAFLDAMLAQGPRFTIAAAQVGWSEGSKGLRKPENTTAWSWYTTLLV